MIEAWKWRPDEVRPLPSWEHLTPPASAEREIRYLRHKATQLRQMANDFQAPISWKLFDVAEQLERRAVELEQRRPEGP